MDIFECAVCLQQFDDPRVISCGHTFCKSCLQKLKPNQLLCPLCRRTFESVDGLPSNFVVLKWMDENKIQNEKEIINCADCEEKPATLWCEICNTYFCDKCNSTVHSGKSTRNHLRISLKEKSKKPTFTKCKNHMRDNEVYCIDCQSLICTICILDYHQQHKAQSVSKCAEEKRVELKSCVEPFKNLQPLIKIEQEIKLAKEKDVLELKSIETRAQVLKNQIIQHDEKIQQITTRTEKVRTSEIVLMNSIQEMRDMDLLDNKNIEQMKRKIQDVLNEVYPEGDKERLEKERLEKERLENERLELLEQSYTKKILPVEWWDNTGPLGGIRKGTHRSKQIYFIVSQSDKWDKGALYVPPDGYQWISTEEYPKDGDNVFSFYNEGGWDGYTWNGKQKYYFIFKDSHKTNKAKHAGTNDRYGFHEAHINNFAGIVCTK